MKISEIKIYRILLVTCLLILSAESLLMVYLYNNHDANNKHTTGTDDSFAKVLVDNMSFLRPFELQSEEYTLSPETVIRDEDGQLLSFNDIFGNDEYVLVFRFSEMHCDICINQHFMMFKELSSKINLNKLVLLSSYSNTKKIKILKHTHKLDFRIFNIMDDIGIPMEKVNNPYFFVVNKNLECHRFFTAIKENPELTISCVKAILTEEK
jgi:peroxiredoxin